MLVVGLTGGIGAGKTTVAAMFRALGATVIDADGIVQMLYRKENVKKALVEEFGAKILTSRGAVDRKFLASIVFSDAAALHAINCMVHPLVFQEIKKRLRLWRRRVVFIDAPLLFEAGLAGISDAVVVVNAPKAVRLKRLAAAGYGRSDALARMRCQLDTTERIKLADFIIDNSGSLSMTKRQVKRVYGELRGMI